MPPVLRLSARSTQRTHSTTKRGTVRPSEVPASSMSRSSAPKTSDVAGEVFDDDVPTAAVTDLSRWLIDLKTPTSPPESWLVLLQPAFQEELRAIWELLHCMRVQFRYCITHMSIDLSGCTVIQIFLVKLMKPLVYILSSQILRLLLMLFINWRVFDGVPSFGSAATFGRWPTDKISMDAEALVGHGRDGNDGDGVCGSDDGGKAESGDCEVAATATELTASSFGLIIMAGGMGSRLGRNVSGKFYGFEGKKQVK